MKTKFFLGTLAVLGLLTLRAAAQMTVDGVLTNGVFEPYAVAVDSDNLVYIADSSNHRIAKYDPTTSILSTLSGTAGSSGATNGPAYLARFNSPQGLLLANLSGEPGLIVADTGNHALRFVNLTNGFTRTLAGTIGTAGSATDAAGTNAHFRYPIGLALDAAGILYIADSKNNVIRQMNLADPAFNVTTLTVANTTLREPNAVSVLSTNQLWIADTRNHTIKLVTRTGATTATLTTLIGSDNPNSSGSADNNFGGLARFSNPRGVFWLGNAGLIIADTGNQTLRLATNNPAEGFGSTNYTVVTIAGAAGQSGLVNGTALSSRFSGPHGLGRDVLGNGIYIADTANSAIRRLQTGPTQSPVSDPQVGWVDFVRDSFGDVTSVLRTDQPFVFNNDQIIAILAEPATESYFTFGKTPPSPFEDNIPSPTRNNGTTPPFYRNGLHASEVGPTIVAAQPDVTVKAIGIQDGRRSSAVTSARFQFKVATPSIVGDNSAAFTVDEVTVGSQIYYTLDGSDPTNALPSIGPITPGTPLSFVPQAEIVSFRARAFRSGYKTSEIATKQFERASYVPNRLAFGFDSGEASSEFVGSPGQFFYAPVTLSLLKGTKMYSLQFNITVTNNSDASPAVAPGAVGFQSTLVRPDPSTPGVYWTIPPSMSVPLVTNYVVYTNVFIQGGVTNLITYTNTLYVAPTNPPPGEHYLTPYPFLAFQPFQDLRFTNTSANLIGVGWLERKGLKYLYDTTLHDLIRYSQPHDTIFLEDNLQVVLGGYAFKVPSTAQAGDAYRIQLGNPSATSDGVGGPGNLVTIEVPSTGSLTNGAINGTKLVRIGQNKYIAGDAAPFRWFNAGDFGNSNLLNDDVMQVFQSAVYGLDAPLLGSDMYDAMDSCCVTYTPRPGTDYLVPSTLVPNDANRNAFFDGSLADINTIAFGDGALDVTDVYVTFRRSIDPSLVWFKRYWTNNWAGSRVAQQAGNLALPLPVPAQPLPATNETPVIRFSAGTGISAPGQTVFVPITAAVAGTTPLRVLALGLSVIPLDGSPALTTQVAFNPTGALGQPGILAPRSLNNYSAAWLDSTIAGVTGDVQLGFLVITLPTNCPANAAYAIQFDHASGSPNGLASFKTVIGAGLVTASDRSASSFNDGIPDSWRLRYFGTAYNTLSQAAADADGDGADNLQEYRAGTNPNDSGSVLKLKSKQGQSPSLSVRWPSVLNKQYVIERAPSVYSGPWTSVSTNNGTGWDLEYQDSHPAPGANFYRIRVAQ